MSALIELERVDLSYGAHRAIRSLSLEVHLGQIACVLGPSGCGKTSVLRCIAGFERVQGGSITLGGTVVSGPGIHVPPETRRIGMVFQDYALFPHLSAAANIGFGLQKLSRKERSARIDELLAIAGLDSLRDRYPHELSGGEQQRVALARALATRPQLLLLDEPFSNMDSDLRERLSAEVREVLKQQGATAILVTHDQQEAFAMSDQIGVMAEGSIQQWDSVHGLYHRPANRFVADFVGRGAFVAGTYDGHDRIATELGVLTGEIPHSSDRQACAPEVEVLLRPQDVVHDESSPLRALVLHKAFLGAEILYTLRLPGGAKVLSVASSDHDHPIGRDIGIRPARRRVVAFPRVDG